MKKIRYPEKQRAFALRQAGVGTPVVQVCRKLGISEQTFYRWKKKYGGRGVGELRRLQQLEEENRKLTQRVADLSLDTHTLQDVLARKAWRFGESCGSEGDRQMLVVCMTETCTRPSWGFTHRGW